MIGEAAQIHMVIGSFANVCFLFEQERFARFMGRIDTLNGKEGTNEVMSK